MALLGSFFYFLNAFFFTNTCEVSYRSVNPFVYLQLFKHDLSHFFYNEKNVYQAVIKFIFFEGVAPKEIHKRLLKLE